jgi:hypothetical protein
VRSSAKVSSNDFFNTILSLTISSTLTDLFTDAIEAAYAAPDGHVIFGQARRFIETRDPSGLDAGVRARFAKALSRMTDEADTVTSHAAALRGR